MANIPRKPANFTIRNGLQMRRIRILNIFTSGTLLVQTLTWKTRGQTAWPDEEHFYAPINVKPEGGGGRADHGILIVSAVPRVGILIVRDAPRVGILIVCHPHGGEIWHGRHLAFPPSWKIPRRHLDIWMSFTCSSKYGEWVSDLLLFMQTLSFLSFLSAHWAHRIELNLFAVSDRD